MRLEHVVSAEPGWRAVFKEPDGTESLSRVIAWAVVPGEEDSELVGVIVDPTEPSQIVSVRDASSPAGGDFARYRYIPPEPPPAPAAPPPEKTKEPESAEQIAKSFLKRRR
jgi:hypothetical protein